MIAKSVADRPPQSTTTVQERNPLSPEPLIKLKSRGAEPMPWDFPDVDPPGVSPDMPLVEAEFVAVDIETTGNRPFLVLEIGAERFRLDSTLSFFDTLVNCRAPINPYARRRHLIERAMLAGAPEFSDARRAFLHFARASILVEHSHDAFDTWIIGRGLPRSVCYLNRWLVIAEPFFEQPLIVPRTVEKTYPLVHDSIPVEIARRHTNTLFEASHSFVDLAQLPWTVLDRSEICQV